FEHDVAALRAQRHLHGVGEDVHAPLEPAARFLVERDHLGHSALSSWTACTHLRTRPRSPRSRPSVGPDSPRRLDQPAQWRTVRTAPTPPHGGCRGEVWHSPSASANTLFSTLARGVQATPAAPTPHTQRSARPSDEGTAARISRGQPSSAASASVLV